jgi:hypothetical protein
MKTTYIILNGSGVSISSTSSKGEIPTASAVVKAKAKFDCLFEGERESKFILSG